jgi:hypothetical protein
MLCLSPLEPGPPLGPLANCYTSPEVFTTELRAKANAIVQVIHYSISLIITQCSPIALATVGWKYYVGSSTETLSPFCTSVDIWH